MADFNWNNDDYQDERNFDPVPADIYTLRCVKAELKETKSRNGELISAQFEIVAQNPKTPLIL